MLVNAMQLLQNFHRDIDGVNVVLDTFTHYWKENEYYVINRQIRPTYADPSFFFIATNTGTSGPVEPSFANAVNIGDQVIDNDIVWEAVSNQDDRGWPLSQLSPSSFPLVISSEGNGNWISQANDSIAMRTMTAYVFMYPFEKEYYGLARNEAAALLQNFGDKYTLFDDKVLSEGDNLIVTIENHTLQNVADTGLIVMEYAGEDFYGFQYDLVIRVMVRR